MRTALLVAAFVAAGHGCGKKDDHSAATDQAGQELREAQTEVIDHRSDIAKTQEDIEQGKRDLLLEQQTLADKQKLLEKQRQDLGAASGTLQEARAAYAAAVRERLAKVDASLATLATRSDARAKDAFTGIRARREQLSAKVDAMADTEDAKWKQYTEDVDVTFDAIERDLRASD